VRRLSSSAVDCRRRRRLSSSAVDHCHRGPSWSHRRARLASHRNHRRHSLPVASLWTPEKLKLSLQ